MRSIFSLPFVCLAAIAFYLVPAAANEPEIHRCFDFRKDPKTHEWRIWSPIRVYVMGQKHDLVRIMEGEVVLYDAYAETRDASGDGEIVCDDIIIANDYILLRLGQYRDNFHAYAFIRDGANKIVALQQLQLNEHDGRISYSFEPWNDGDPREGFGLRYGEKGDRRTTVCWRPNSLKWWWSGGESRREKYAECDEVIPVDRQKLICVQSGPPNPCM